MNAAPLAVAPPAAAPVLDLPPAFAAALATGGTVRVRDPRTGARFRLVPDAAEGPAPPESHYDSGRTLAEEVDEAIAEADAGLGRPWAEVRAELLAELPFLAEPAAANAGRAGAP